MKKITLNFVFLLITASVFSQDIENALLWRITGNQLEHDSYLFGTIHLVPKRMFEINDSIEKYLDASETLMLEIDPEIPLGEQIKLAQQMLLPDGASLQQYMDAERYALLYGYLKDSLEIKPQKIDRYMMFKPVFMQSLVLAELVKGPKAFETEIKALSKNKNFVPLETVDQQMALLDSISIEDQLDFSGESYKLDKEYYKLLNLYLQQDLNAIDSLMFSDPAFKKIEYQLLTGRNQNWIPKIESTLKAGSVFVAVGAAHFIGPNGLIALLREKGYQLEPIFFE